MQKKGQYYPEWIDDLVIASRKWNRFEKGLGIITLLGVLCIFISVFLFSGNVSSRINVAMVIFVISFVVSTFSGIILYNINRMKYLKEKKECWLWKITRTILQIILLLYAFLFLWGIIIMDFKLL